MNGPSPRLPLRPGPGSGPRLISDRARPAFPARAVVTAGMPYGNKDLHFGHIGGVFIQADAYARFLRDRLGAENVLFVSGTDCFGSPIVEDHRKRVAAGELSGTLAEFARANHERQAETLRLYSVEPDAYGASALEPYVSVHGALGASLMQTLHAHGHLEARSTLQFFDETADQFLTGRQVVGHCPHAGCKSERAYAEECDLGHQFEPRDLVAPVSSLSGEKPVMREVTNWYLPLEPFRAALQPYYDGLLACGAWREFSVRNLLEYFEPPTVHVKADLLDTVRALADRLPPFTIAEGKGPSARLVFKTFDEIERATSVLAAEGLRYRSAKTLAPFRLTGNLDWGLPAPELAGPSGQSYPGLTFWVWPESLWAPISFTSSVLQARGEGPEAWRRWWCEPDARAYQFIGEDNIFYYGLAELALFLGAQGREFSTAVPPGHLQLPVVVTNKHLLFLDKKASSSGKVKPPSARALLEHYTPEQLRIHFLSLALGARNANFRPKAFDDANDKGPDPVLKDGNVLCDTLNRLARSCFYAAQKHFDGRLPTAEVSAEVVETCERALLDYEAAMHRLDLHVAVEAAAALLRAAHKRWNERNPFHDDCDPALRPTALADGFHALRVALLMLHPVAPVGTELVRRYLRVGEELWSWERAFDALPAFCADPADHRLEELQPKVDFFEKHPSQLEATQ